MRPHTCPTLSVSRNPKLSLLYPHRAEKNSLIGRFFRPVRKIPARAAYLVIGLKRQY